MKPDKDRQQFHSIFDNVTALLNQEDFEYKCELIDISLQGCLLNCTDTIELPDPEALYTLTLELPDTAPIIMNLSISHAIENEVSFKCEHIDVDDISALRYFVKLNCAESALLDRQLIELTHCC